MVLGWQIALTITISIGIIGMITLEKIFIDKAKENINNFLIIGSYIFMFVVLIVAVFGVMTIWGYDIQPLMNTTISSILLVLSDNVNRLISSGFVIAITIALNKITRISLRRIGTKPSPMQRRKKTIAKVTISIVKYILAIIMITVILSIWGVNVTPILAGVGAIGLIIGLGAQKFINDLISGFFIIFEHHFDVGDKIEVKGFKGDVIDIGLKTTKIKNWRGEVKILSNGDINDITNFSLSESIAVVDFGIAYKEDVAKTTMLLNLELPKLRKEVEEIIEDPQVLGVVDLANSSVNMRVIAKTLTEKHYAVERAIRQRIKEILDANKIEIPFPQVVVHGVK
jgi:small conductance mechanosensitive channel